MNYASSFHETLCIYLFVYLGSTVFCRVPATVHGTTTRALNSTSPHERWTTTEKTRKSTHLQMYLQRQHFLLSYLKTLTITFVLPRFEPTASRSAGQGLLN